jgi:hypothetical protein
VIPDTTPRQRRVVLWAGVLLAAVINYLDLLGVLRLALTPPQLALTTGAWTVLVLTQVPALPDGLEEAQQFALDAAGWAMAVLGLLVLARVFHPDVSPTYLLHATLEGQVVLAWTGAVFWPVVALLEFYLIGWVLDYQRYRRTTPEQRVLD